MPLINNRSDISLSETFNNLKVKIKVTSIICALWSVFILMYIKIKNTSEEVGFCLVLIGGCYTIYKCVRYFDEMLAEYQVKLSEFTRKKEQNYKLESELSKKTAEYNIKIDSLNEKEKWLNIREVNYNEYIKIQNKLIEKRKNILKTLEKEGNYINTIPSLLVDLETLLSEQCAVYLETKENPAIKTANKLREYQKKASNAIKKERKATYLLESLLSQYPQMKVVLEEYEEYGIEECVNRYFGVNTSNEDDVKKYLSDNEYQQLSVKERNQLALDRYINRNKTKWEIGRDYEMSCADLLRRNNFKVETCGITQKFEDLGRDIIAKRDDEGIFVIQCKYWSQNRIIRENVIMQLYGTYIAYIIENKSLGKKVRPVLMIPENATLSETAEIYRKILKVKVRRFNFCEFPRIKCNINNGNKIYHLPFDQQYDRTKIENEGECYVFTVEEAENLGFRRAQRHRLNSN